MHVPPRSRGAARQKAERSFAVRTVVLPVQGFIHTAGLSGMVLVAAALVAIVWANSPWAHTYHVLQHAKISLDLGVLQLSESLQHWVNDLLMTFFFFVVGLEIKRELVEGELSDVRRAALPVIAALGGMVVPALLYLACNRGTPTESGWGVPMATDIAFALGVLALLGDRIPPAGRVLLLALAIVDDIGAIVVIALFYAQGIETNALVTAGGLLVLVLVLRRLGVWTFMPYVVVGALLWLATFRSGVHATLAGVVLGLLTPSKPWYGLGRFAEPARQLLARFEHELAVDDREEAEAVLGQFEELCRQTESPLDRLLRVMHAWTSYLVLPLFALVNAGVELSLPALQASATSRVTLGIMLGLIVGKTVGVFGSSWLAVQLGVARLPDRVTWTQVFGMAILAGIGFTVSLFISDLAFESEADLNAAKIGILAASVIAGVLGYLFLARQTAPAAVETASAAH